MNGHKTFNFSSVSDILNVNSTMVVNQFAHTQNKRILYQEPYFRTFSPKITNLLQNESKRKIDKLEDTNNKLQSHLLLI